MRTYKDIPYRGPVLWSGRTVIYGSIELQGVQGEESGADGHSAVVIVVVLPTSPRRLKLTGGYVGQAVLEG